MNKHNEQEFKVLESFLEFIKEKRGIDFGLTIEEFQQNRFKYRECWNEKEEYFWAGFEMGSKKEGKNK